MFQIVRLFFDKRGVLEVDCPALSPYASIDPHIDVMQVNGCGYLHTSPEYAMKRLLAEGAPDIFQMSHVFRKEEKGSFHSPEFTMIEWYRLNLKEAEFQQETIDLISLFIGPSPLHKLSYHEAFLKFTGLDISSASPSDYLELAKRNGLDIGERNFLWGTLVEPHFTSLTMIIDFPAEDAALAKVENGVAKRFEIYFRGVELANGYHELQDPVDQKRRLVQSEKERQKLGKPPLPRDLNFLQALEKGLPECFGVAVGFDRLMMLRLNQSDITNVLPIPAQ